MTKWLLFANGIREPAVPLLSGPTTTRIPWVRKLFMIVAAFVLSNA